MKKVLLALGICALATFSFSSCQKELKNADEENKLVKVSFTAEKAGTETKTAAVPGETSVSYIWTNEDVNNIKLFIVGSETKQEEGKEPYEVETLTQVVNPTIEKVSDEKLTITAQVAPNATYKFRAVLAGAWTNDGKKPRISDEQNPSETNYDPNADILVSDDMEVSVIDSGEETISTNALEMVFRRQVVVNKMILRNLNAGETITKVTVQSDKYLAGYVATDTKKASGDKKIITLNYNNTVPEGGEFPVYFTTIPGASHSLRIDVTTEESIYSKSFAEGATINFNQGQYTKFIVALPDGEANTALPLPVEDSMDWATTGGSDATAELTSADFPDVNGKKIYDSATKAYKGGDGMKLGSSSAAGLITTSDINLSSPFHVVIDAKTYGSDVSQLKIMVDGEEKYTSDNLSSTYETYFCNLPAATAKSKVTITISGKRGYIKNLVIGSGSFVAPPKINITSSNPLEVANTASSQSITYSIDNPTDAVLSASTTASWITDLDCSSSGSVSFNVAAQAESAPEREAIITLTYEGATSVDFTVKQAAGEGGVSTYSYLFTSKSWTATLDGETADWTSGQDGSGFSNGGIQVTTTTSGANGTSPCSFTDIEEIIITYCTNSSKGKGTIKVTVGSGATQSFSVSAPSSGGTTAKTHSFTYSTKESGKVKIEIDCATNSLYLIGASVTAKGIDDSGSSSGGNQVVKGNPWTSGDFDSINDIPSTINGVQIATTINPSSCETTNGSNYAARGLAWSSGKSPIITLKNYSGGVETVTIVMSTNGAETSVAVASGETSLDSQPVSNGTANANTAYTFTFDELKTGNITITVTNTTSKSVYIKSISIN